MYILTRWSIPFAGFLLALIAALGYAWGPFVVPIVDRFGWTTAEATLPFTVLFVILALMTILGGRLQDRLGPRKVAAMGALLFIPAYGLAALVGHFPYPWWLLLTYSLIGGVAGGMVYACVAPPARKWFPDRPGLAISFAVMGAGLAGLFLAPLKADYLIPAYGIEGTLLILAIIATALGLFAAWLIRNPPDGWEPPGWERKMGAKQVRALSESTPRDLIRSPIFWIIWLTFALVIWGGLMCWPLIPPFGELVVGLTPVEAAVAVAIFSVFNGFGRPVAGFLADRFGTVWVMIVTYVIQAMTLLSFHVFAVSLPTLYIAAALVGWGFAVTLGLFPVLTAFCFGTKHLGVNYGMVFTAFGVGAFAPAAGGAMYDITGSFTPAFVSAGIMAVIGLVLCVVLKGKYSLA
ncbi:OFA family MFS transporter [Dehalococcoidia bacterium]|nr:OFA family MFS transporter [Dehalococcoidia bacterium]